MVLLETLGPRTGLFAFPPEAIDGVMGTFLIDDFQSQNLLLANYAELGAFNACMTDTVRWPLLLPPAMLPLVVYKTNTITYTCGYHQGYVERRSEYAFLFTSDCWKLREILHDEPLEQLIRDPLAVRQRVAESGWRQVGGDSRSQDVFRDLSLLLWYAKALLIAKPEGARAELPDAVLKLHRSLDLRQV
jgi:hypothetical protein